MHGTVVGQATHVLSNATAVNVKPVDVFLENIIAVPQSRG